LIVLKRPKESIFDEIGMEPMRAGVLHVDPSKGSRTSKQQIHKPQKIELSYYGTQDVAEVPDEEEERKDIEAIRFGTALHYALEMMASFRPESIAQALTAVRNRYGQMLNEDALREIEKRLQQLVDEPHFQAMLQKADIRKEQGLFFNGQMKQIDLLLVLEDKMIVVDYKSSQKYHAAHQEQVRGYMKAVEAITKKPTEGVLIYLLKEEIIIENLK